MTAKMKCPDGVTHVSVQGQEFQADKNGVVEVPGEAVSDLLNHGLVLHTEQQKVKAVSE